MITFGRGSGAIARLGISGVVLLLEEESVAVAACGDSGRLGGSRCGGWSLADSAGFCEMTSWSFLGVGGGGGTSTSLFS